jgi:hypothetical protein
MVRLMLFVRHPYSLSAEEAVGWMREQTAPLAAMGAERVELVRLGAPGVHGSSDCEWLIEIYYERVEDAASAARNGPCRDLIADLRLLGMRPQLVVAPSGEPLEG